MGRVNFSRQYTHFFCWVYSISEVTSTRELRRNCNDAHAPRWHFVRDDRAARDTRKGSAIDFYFWPGIEQQSRYENDDDNENLLIFRFYTITFWVGWQFSIPRDNISVYCYKQGIYKGVVYNNPHQKNMQGAKK